MPIRDAITILVELNRTPPTAAEALEILLGCVDYNAGAVAITASVGAAVPGEILALCHVALKAHRQ